MSADEKANILIVDDNPAKRLALAAVLKGLDQNLVAAESGREALRLLLSDEYAVILLDVQMPQMDGFETAALIRSRGQSEATPIIFVTAYTETDILRGYSFGAVDYLFTPIVPEILCAKVSVFVDLYRKTRAIRRHEQQLESLVEQRTAALTAEIAERMRIQERLYHLAHHDVLTDIPNRMLFAERLGQALNRVPWRKRLIAVLLLDLDRFKLVNDTLGHAAGDRLLRETSMRLLACVRQGDTVARFGGDEFAVLLNDVASRDDVAPIARKLLEALALPFNIDGHELLVAGSLGISVYPGDGTDGQALMKNADTAMYRAKQLGGNTWQFYHADMNALALERLELETALRRALARRELVLHYQPQFDLSGGGIAGLEALIRWLRPGPQAVQPAELIALLEQTGLSVAAGEWALQAACAQHAAWRAAGLPPLRVAVNISGWQLNGANLAATVQRAIQDNRMDPGFLEIEMTESLAMESAQAVVETLQSLNSMGVRLALDDFGSGYSSLGRLKRLPIDVLKIDRVLVQGAAGDPADAAIVRAIIALAHDLGIRVAANGVESREQLAFLRAQRCDIAQGRYLGPPQAAGEIERLLGEEKRLFS